MELKAQPTVSHAKSVRQDAFEEVLLEELNNDKVYGGPECLPAVPYRQSFKGSPQRGSRKLPPTKTLKSAEYTIPTREKSREKYAEPV